MAQAFLALGGNIGDRMEMMRRAVLALQNLPKTKVTAISHIYETPPWGYTKQAAFYNAVALVDTSLSAHALLGACLGIEAGMGRVRSFKNGPRVMDIDLLLYEGARIDTPELTVPHPRMEERAFVLVPLCDIHTDPYYREILKKMPREGIIKVDENIIL